LITLVKIRAAELNGCAYCLQQHTGEARRQGETADRIVALAAWRESRLFTPRERAALAWIETVIPTAHTGLSEDEIRLVGAAFPDEVLVNLTMVALAVDAWHRIAIGFRLLHPADGRDAAA
jgi:AhpD family alkylhydroperoxidase